MVTPMTADGSLDFDGAARLADYLVDEHAQRRPGDQRHHRRVADHDRRGEGAAAARRARGGRRPGHGRGRRGHQRHRAHHRAGQAAPSGRARTACSWSPRTTTSRRRPACTRTSPRSPTPPGCRSCCTTSRAGPAPRSPPRRCVRLAEHPRIVAVKDAKGDLGAGSVVMARTDLAFYCGDDMLNLPWLSVGACGFVSVHAHVVGDRLHDMIDAYLARRRGRRAGRSTEPAAGVHRHVPHPGRDHWSRPRSACSGCPAARSARR